MNLHDFMKKAIENRTKIRKSMAEVARQVYTFSKARDSFKSTICKVTTFLQENKDLLDFEAKCEMYYFLEQLREKELKVETKLTDRRRLRCEMIEVLKKVDNETVEIRRELVKQEREFITKSCRVMMLEKKIVDLKRELRQKEIRLEIKNDPLLKVAEDECIEILKSRLNVD